MTNQTIDGEPVAWQYRIVEDGKPLFNPLKKDGWVDTVEGVAKDMAERPSLSESRHYEVRKLYAEQPAPVAVKEYQNKINHLKQLLRNVRATLQFSPEDVLAIDAALREDEDTGSKINQCDGCQAGIPLINGTHRMGEPDGYANKIKCTADLYK